METWPVLVESWQIECCGTPVSLGESVSWRLAWLDRADTGLPDELLTTFEGDAVPYGADGPDGSATVLTSGAVTALWRAPRRVEGRVSVRGLLMEEHHGGVPEELPVTSGVVGRIRVLTQAYVLVEPKTWRIAPGRAWLRDVETSPEWFTDSDAVQADGTRLAETGVLVDLAVGPDAAG